MDDHDLPFCAFADEEGTQFTIEVPEAEDLEALLHTIDHENGHINLYFQIPINRALRNGTYRVQHSRLGGFEARFEQVQAGGREPDQVGYRAVVTE